MNKKSITILAILATVILGGIALFTAIRLNQLGTGPVAPNVPGSTPSAADITNACSAISFAITIPTPTPTPTPSVTPSPTPAPTPQPAIIGNFVWNDTNQNGIQDAGEAGVPGVTVTLYNSTGGIVATTTTNSNGNYSFTVPAGTYSTGITPPTGYSISPANQGTNDALDSDVATSTGKTNNFTVTAGQTNNTNDAGIYLPPSPTPSPTPAATPFPTPAPTLPPSITAQCLNIKVFDSNWNELTPAQLSTFTAGQVVRFTVGGTASTGSFDQARFTINGTQRTAVTTKRPGTNEFYDEYTLPSGIGQFTINAQLHHSTLGWF